jgi:hypothetical protein
VWSSATTNATYCSAALYELWITRSAFDDDPEADKIPLARHFACPAIMDMVVKFGGDPDAVHFGVRT